MAGQGRARGSEDQGGAKEALKGRKAEVEPRARKPEVVPRDPHSRAELVTGRSKTTPHWRVAMEEELKGNSRDRAEDLADNGRKGRRGSLGRSFSNDTALVLGGTSGDTGDSGLGGNADYKSIGLGETYLVQGNNTGREHSLFQSISAPSSAVVDWGWAPQHSLMLHQ